MTIKSDTGQHSQFLRCLLLATIVALHFTPVSKSVSQSVIVSEERSLELASLLKDDSLKQKASISVFQEGIIFTLNISNWFQSNWNKITFVLDDLSSQFNVSRMSH